MKKVIIVFAIAMLYALGAQAADFKAGYVDLNKALNESDEGKKANKTLEETLKARQLVIEEKRKEIAKLEEDLSKQASILTPDALKDKKDEREKLIKEFQRIGKDAEDEIEKKRTDFMDRIIKDLAEIIKKTGDEEGYTVIFEKNSVVYMPEKLDLTDKVIRKYNESSKAEKKQ